MGCMELGEPLKKLLGASLGLPLVKTKVRPEDGFWKGKSHLPG